MVEKSVVTGIVGGLNDSLVTALHEFVDARNEGFARKIKEGSAEEVSNTLQEIRRAVEGVVKGTFYEGIRVADFTSVMNVYAEDGKVSSVNLIVKSKPASGVSIRRAESLTVTEDIASTMCEIYRDVAVQMLYASYANENIEALNGYIDAACEEAGVPYRFAFTLGDKYIASVSDEKVVFGIGVDKALEIPALADFATGDEFSEFVASSEKEKLVSALKPIQTVPQLIKANLPHVVSVIGSKTLKRADSLIRLSYHQQAKYFNKTKAGIGYFAKTVKIGDEEVSIFSLLQKAEDGTISVVLSPFDVKTNFKVSFDVIAAVEAEMKEAVAE